MYKQDDLNGTSSIPDYLNTSNLEKKNTKCNFSDFFEKNKDFQNDFFSLLVDMGGFQSKEDIIQTETSFPLMLLSRLLRQRKDYILNFLEKNGQNIDEIKSYEELFKKVMYIVSQKLGVNFYTSIYGDEEFSGIKDIIKNDFGGDFLNYLLDQYRIETKNKLEEYHEDSIMRILSLLNPSYCDNVKKLILLERSNHVESLINKIGITELNSLLENIKDDELRYIFDKLYLIINQIDGICIKLNHKSIDKEKLVCLIKNADILSGINFLNIISVLTLIHIFDNYDISSIKKLAKTLGMDIWNRFKGGTMTSQEIEEIMHDVKIKHIGVR